MLIAVLLSAAAVSDAQPAAPISVQSAVDPLTLEAAVAFLDAMDFEAEALRGSEMSMEASIALIVDRLYQQTRSEVPADLMASLTQVMRDHVSGTMRAKMPEMKRRAAEIYAREFTRDELARMRILSADPVMVKFRQKGKTIDPQLMMIGIDAMRESEPDFRAKVGRLVEDYLRKIGKSAATS